MLEALCALRHTRLHTHIHMMLLFTAALTALAALLQYSPSLKKLHTQLYSFVHFCRQAAPQAAACCVLTLLTAALWAIMQPPATLPLDSSFKGKSIAVLLQPYAHPFPATVVWLPRLVCFGYLYTHTIPHCHVWLVVFCSCFCYGTSCPAKNIVAAK